MQIKFRNYIIKFVMIGIINYGMGNIGSISNMLKKIGFDSEIISDPKLIHEATGIILPGVGSFDNAMDKLNNGGWVDEIKLFVSQDKPFLGICLGMQLLGSKSQEGIKVGLNLIPGEIIKFPREKDFKIPHMGWNSVKTSDTILFKDLNNLNKFYFVHTYHFVPKDDKHILSTTDYFVDFVSSIRKKNIFGVQFHPEKSHKFGMKLLENFCKYIYY